jgi:protein required for attachment to host cells
MEELGNGRQVIVRWRKGLQMWRSDHDRLFVIAHPRTLGELRKHVHATLRAKIVGELPLGSAFKESRR